MQNTPNVKYTLRKADFTLGGEFVENNIKQLRMQHDLSQDQLAEKLGVSRQTIISLEKGRYNPSITLAFKLARLFNCYIEDIFIFEEE